MDKEQAKFILQSFRPDGADASNKDFKEALELATRDRELGAWLAEERATDAGFAEALGHVEIPEQLRQDILAVMHGEQASDPELDQEMDALFQDSLADVEPPEGLRDQILTAMQVQQSGASNVTQMPSARRKSPRRFFSIAAIAAALVLGAFLAVQVTGNRDHGPLASYEVQQTAGNLLNASFQLDERSPDVNELNTWLVSHEMPSASDLPEPLRKMKSIGCKKIKLPGDKVASLVCFTTDSGGRVHLIIVRNTDLSDDNLPTKDKVKESDCYHCPTTDWNVARWKDSKHTFILMSKQDEAQKNDMLRYF